MDWKFWDERYAGAGYLYGEEPNDFLRDEAHRIPPGRVLSLAEGEGRNAVFLASLGYSVTAVDYSVEGLKKAEALAKKRGVSVELIHADLTSWNLPAGFSGIVSIWGHLYPDARRQLYEQLAGSLVVGGCFLLEAYRPEQIGFGTGGPKDPALLPTAASLRQDLTGLDLFSVKDVERDVGEGKHAGRSATVQVIAYRR